MWKEVLGVFKHTRLTLSSEPVDVGWMGDASTGYGIGFWIGKQWAQFGTRNGWRGPGPKLRDISWLETVAVRLGLLALLQLGSYRGKSVIVWTDNTTTEGAIRNRKSDNPFVNEEWKAIQYLLIENKVDLVSKRVTSKDNRADALSRGDWSGCNIFNQISVPMPKDLEDLLCIVIH